MIKVPQRRTGRVARTLLSALLVCLILTTGVAWACPICFSGRLPMLGQKIDSADAIVLATPLGDAGPYRVMTSIKGEIPDGMIILDATSAAPDFIVKGFPSLIIRNKSSQQWTAIGSVSASQVDWLRAFVATGPSTDTPAKKSFPRTLYTTADPSDQDWITRLALVAPVLESSDRLVAQIAYGEIARAPYRLLRSLKGTRDPAEVLTWLNDPELAARRPAYTLLLGVTGGTSQAQYIDARIEEDRAAHRADDLAALITASLEINGPERLHSVTAAFLTDKSRSLPEIEAALLALSVQGTADATIRRNQIVFAYGEFVRAHPPMAGFVVQDLSDWGSFEIANELEIIAKSGAIHDPASLYAITTYLQHETKRPAIASQDAGANLPP